MADCKYYDPTCPCQDGDQCHYETYGDSKGMDPRHVLLARIAELEALNRELTDRLNGIEHKLGAEKQAREAAEARLRELRVAIETIKSIVSDGFLNHREKLEVIESRCDIELCIDALAKSAES